jgi:hypothetical protein
MSKASNEIYRDYFTEVLGKMGSYPEDPALQRELAVYCIANSAEHLVSFNTMKEIIMRYATYFKIETEELEKTALRVLHALVKFLFHGIEDVMYVKYMTEIELIDTPLAMFNLLDNAYREKMMIDADASGEGAALVSPTTTENYNYADFIAASFPGGNDFEAVARKDAIVSAVQKQKVLDPLMMKPYAEPFANFDPRKAVFKVTSETVLHYNQSFRKLGRSAAFLQPVGRYWDRYVKLGMKGNSDDAINTTIRVLSGNATENDYQTFLGIIDVSKGAEYFVTEMIDAPTVSMGHHLQTHHHAAPEPESEYRILHPSPHMDGILDLANPKHLYNTIRTGDPSGKGTHGFSVTGPVRPGNIHKVLLSKNGVYEDDKINVPPADNSYQSSEITTFYHPRNEVYDAENPQRMDGILSLNNPKYLLNTIKTGDPSGTGATGFHPLAPLRPGNVHRVLESSHGEFKNTNAHDADTMRQFDEMDRAEKNGTESRVVGRDNSPSMYEMHSGGNNGLNYETSSTSSHSVYGHPDEFSDTESTSSAPVRNYGYDSYRSLSLGSPMMGPSFVEALKNKVGVLKTADAESKAAFRRRIKAHFGFEKTIWTQGELHALMLAMKTLAAMNIADRNALLLEIITALKRAREEMLDLAGSKQLEAITYNKPTIFRRISSNNIRSEIGMVVADLNPLVFLHYIVEKEPLAPIKDSHVNLLTKLGEAISAAFLRAGSRALHVHAKRLNQIVSPGSELATLKPMQMHPAFVDVDKIAPARLVVFFYDVLVLFCSWSPYAYKEYQNRWMKSIFAHD